MRYDSVMLKRRTLIYFGNIIEEWEKTIFVYIKSRSDELRVGPNEFDYTDEEFYFNHHSLFSDWAEALGMSS